MGSHEEIEQNKATRTDKNKRGAAAPKPAAQKQPAAGQTQEPAPEPVRIEPPARPAIALSAAEMEQLRQVAYTAAYKEAYNSARQEAYKNAYKEAYPIALEEAGKNAFQEASQEAYFNALNQKKTEITGLIQQVGQSLEEMEKMQTAYFETYARQLNTLSLEIAEKLIQRKIEQDDLTLQTLVMETVDRVKNATWLKVEVSDHLLGLVEKLRSDLQSMERAEVVPAPDSDGTVRVSTETGTIDASISTQIDNLRRVFGTE